jgi:hypothetical protein
MAEPKPSQTAFWLLNLAINVELQPLTLLIAETLGKKLPGYSVEQLSDLGEDQLEAVSAWLEQEREKQKEEGIEPTFQLSYEAGTPYFRKIPSDASKFLGALYAISDAQFVDFCVSLLKALGGDALNIDGPYDGGLDFVARNLPLSGLNVDALRRTRILVVGQAKHYQKETLVSEPELRDFVGGALKRTSDPTDSVTHRITTLAPLVFAFWTTSDFNSPAKSYAKAVGVWTLNGIALSQLALKANFNLDAANKIVTP